MSACDLAQGLWGAIMRQAVPSRLRSTSAAHPAANRVPRSPVAWLQPACSVLAGRHAYISQLQRARSHAASLPSHLASLGMLSALLSPTATALAVEPASAAAEQDGLLPAATSGTAEHAGAQQTVAAQQHVVVNFYHLTEIADPEQVLAERLWRLVGAACLAKVQWCLFLLNKWRLLFAPLSAKPRYYINNKGLL